MALSMSPQQFRQPLSPPLSNSLLHSTSGQYRTDVHDMPDSEILLINPTVTVEPDLLHAKVLTAGPPSPEPVTRKDAFHITSASPSRGEPDLSSWTPLETSGGDAAVADNEVDELSSSIADTTRLPMTQPTEPEHDQAPTETPTGAAGILRLKAPSSDAKPVSRGKKARFDSVLITTKPPSYGKRGPRPASVQAPASSSGTRQLSLVDALARTFNANRHTEDPARRHSRTTLCKDDDGSATPADTEAEDEQLQLNTRLAHSPLKRPYYRTRTHSEHVSEHNSEDGTSLLPSRDAERLPVKRLKPILYDAHAALVDAALETAVAPIGWDAELDLITREDDFALPMTPMTQCPPADAYSVEDVQMHFDEGVSGPIFAGQASLPSALAAANAPYVPPRPRRALLPYLSRGARFIQRLDTIYGVNATVRTDKGARPIPADLDFFAFDDLDDNDRGSSPSPSESAASVSAASALEEGADAITIPSTHVTSQSPIDVPSADMVADDMKLGPLSRNELGEVDTSVTQPSVDTSEETIGGWIITLQRLIKGKIRIREDDLETVSIILAEIESIKDNLSENDSMSSELRESVKQLSELHEIPFGDRNKLRQRAEIIHHAWPSMK